MISCLLVVCKFITFKSFCFYSFVFRYPVDEPFLSNVHDEVIYQVKRLQSHASIVIWSGNNENEQAIAQNWYHVPQEKIPKAKDDYRKLYVDTVMNAVKEVDKGDNRPFITSSPTNGLESISENYIATDPENPLYGKFIRKQYSDKFIFVFYIGDVHFYGFYNDSWNPHAYPISRFMSETGVVCLPSLDTWYQVTNNVSDLDFWSDFVQHRQHYPHGQMNLMFVV
jgi:beta-mannosidase